ncbi:MAG: hypothetical protein FJ161_01745 [Gammaproteobacteria bacterium]|nr:hypothetical protein [Gammaproteobacteria bacterium]
MVVHRKPQYSLYIVRVILFLTLLMLGTKWALKSWYDPFFDSLYKKDIESFRIISIISHEHAHEPKWIEGVQSFLSEVRSRTAGNQVFITIDCILDSSVTNEDRHFLEKAFGQSHIEYFDMQELMQEYVTYKWFPKVLLQNVDHALSRDVLKVWALESPYDLNIYIDPVLWASFLDHKATVKSDVAFGIGSYYTQDDAFLIHWLTAEHEKSDRQLMLIDNRMLISSGHSRKGSFIRRQIIEAIDTHSQALEAVLLRPITLISPLSEQEYRNELEQRRIWLSEHPDIPIYDRLWTSMIGGNLFLEFTALDLKISEFYSTMLQLPELNIDRAVRRNSWTYGELLGLYGNNPKYLDHIVMTTLINNDFSIANANIYAKNPNMHGLIQSLLKQNLNECEREDRDFLFAE